MFITVDVEIIFYSLVEKQLQVFSPALNLGLSHRSKNYAWEFVGAFSDVLEEEVFDELRQTKVHSLIIDESTDLACTKHLILLVKYIFKVCASNITLYLIIDIRVYDDRKI